MGRPGKDGLDYFPLDVDIDQDDKFYLIESEYGIEGFGIIIKLFMAIYKNGYYYPWSEKEVLIFCRKNNLNIDNLNKIVLSAIKWGLFDDKLYKNYQILTSSGIQKRYFKSVAQRKLLTVISEYLLISKEFIVNKDINWINIDINPVKIQNKTQSIVKYSKVKESKLKDSKVKETRINNADSDEPAIKEKINSDNGKDRDLVIYHFIQESFYSKLPDRKFTNYGKEGKAIKELIKKAKARSPDRPEEFIGIVINRFSKLREGNEKFWKSQPFIPSALNSSGIFDRVLNEMYLEQEADDTSDLDRIDKELANGRKNIFG